MVYVDLPMVLPNVLVIGAQKCGTSALYQLLRRHPECTVGTIKESHFFVDESPWPFGTWHRGLDWYQSLYDKPGAIVADISPSYSSWPLFPGVPARAAATLPDATIVYLVRDPIDRIVAHWRHWIFRGYESRDFATSVLDPDPLNHYVMCSSYGAQLQQWLEFFPSSQVVALHQSVIRQGALPLLERFGLEAAPPSTREPNVTDRLRRPRRLPAAVRRVLPHTLATKPVPRPEVTAAVAASLTNRLAEDRALFERLTGIAV